MLANSMDRSESHRAVGQAIFVHLRFSSFPPRLNARNPALIEPEMGTVTRMQIAARVDVEDQGVHSDSTKGAAQCLVELFNVVLHNIDQKEY